MRACFGSAFCGYFFVSGSSAFSLRAFSIAFTRSTAMRSPYPTRSKARLLLSKMTPPVTSSGDQTPVPAPKRRRIVSPSATPSPQTIPSVAKEIVADNATTEGARIPDSAFQDLMVPPEELRPSATLTTGQCFHWKALPQALPQEGVKSPNSAWGSHNETEWVGTLRASEGDSLVLVIRETPTTTLFRTLYAPTGMNVASFLRDYFHLDEPLKPLYKQWSEQDTRLCRIAQCIPGVRIVNQDPWECLVSFICSSNNNIPRITKMLSAIRREYGSPIHVDKDEHALVNETFYGFPSLVELQKQATDSDLRKKCGMGYRAKYILETMEILEKLGGEKYLKELKEGSSSGRLSPQEVQDSLIQFQGVGRKVADCTALFSLKQSGAIPVDVHVWNIACRDYDDEGILKNVRSLTPAVYRQVGDLFRSRFVQKAGWAHSLLFVAELPSFRPVLPEDLITEMDKVRKMRPADSHLLDFPLLSVAHFLVGSVLAVS
jgi:N-glycosylase/DNA lyase